MLQADEYSLTRDSLASERFQTAVLAAFGIAALLLATAGINGVFSYAVPNASRRLALGWRSARPGRASMR